jgi:hypothetical protein
MVGWNEPGPLILNEYGTSVEYNAHGNTRVCVILWRHRVWKNCKVYIGGRL